MRRLIVLYVIILMSVVLAGNVCAEPLGDVYKVGVNDLLEIKVLDHSELSTRAAVSSDGTITFPYLGTVYVKDKKISEIEEDVEKRLSEGYVNFPSVSVSLLQSMSRRIFTYGEFYQRGQIPFEDKMTLLNAMSLAGGVMTDGLYGTLKVKRKRNGKAGHEDIVKTKLNNGIIEDAKIKDMTLKPDDILIIEKNETFLIQGQVASRGRFVIEKGMTVLRALLLAGGVSSDGLYGLIKVRRMNEGTYDYKDFVKSRLNDGSIERPEVENTLLQPNDIVIVQKNETFLIQGEFANRGRFVLEKGMTVLRAMLLAGGVRNDGLYGKIRVRRKQGAAGYKDIAKSNIVIGVIESHEVEEMQLEPDDILIVDMNSTYFIYGEAQRTGEFVLKNNMTVFNALTIAGGFTKWGSGNRVKILRQNRGKSSFETLSVNINDVINGKVDADIYLEPGDTIIISSGLF